MYDNEQEFKEKLKERHGWLCVRWRDMLTRGNTTQQEADEIEKELALVEQLIDFYGDATV